MDKRKAVFMPESIYKKLKDRAERDKRTLIATIEYLLDREVTKL